jgi:hypothetical protein
LALTGFQIRRILSSGNRRQGNRRQRSAFPVVLNPGSAQPGKAVFVDRGLPIQKLVNAERVSLARFLEAQKASADSRHHLRFSADHPTTGVGGGKVRNRQRAAIGPNYVLNARAHRYGHFTLTLNLTIFRMKLTRLA